MNPTFLQTSEIFGPTVQGEGPFTGMQCMFVRTQGCSVGCSWCDSRFTWPQKPELKRTVNGIIQELEERAGPHVRVCIVSGGEPFEQAEEVAELSSRLLHRGWELHFETSGTRIPSKKQSIEAHYTVSPKPPSARTQLNSHPEAIKWFKERWAYFKFVVRDREDFVWVKEFIKEHGIDGNSVYLMPEGINHEQIQKSLQFLWEAVHEIPGAQLTGRLHIEAWGPKRGV